MRDHLKSLAVKTTATVIAIVVCAVAAFLLNRLIVSFDAGIKAPVFYVLPTLEETQKPTNLSRVSF
jgi:hypothetical protein